jgi:hypothetical protein
LVTPVLLLTCLLLQVAQLRASERVAATLLQGQLQPAAAAADLARKTGNSNQATAEAAAAGLDGLGLDQQAAMVAAAAADSSVAIDVKQDASTVSEAAAGSEQQQQPGVRSGGSFGSLTAARARGLLSRGSFGQLGELAQRVTAHAASAAGPAGTAAAAQLQRLLGNTSSSSSVVGGLLSSSSSSSAMRGQVSARVWLLVGYVSVLHLCLMVAFTSKAAPASLSPAELLKLCGGAAAAGLGAAGNAAAAGRGGGAAADPRANALP